MGKNLPQFVAQWGTIDTPTWYEGQKGWGNHHEPDVYVATTNADYPIGTKFIDGERVYYYGYMHTDEDAAGTARAGQGICNIEQESKPTTTAVEHAIGERTISLVDTTSTVNQWAGGYFCPMASPYGITYRIVSSTANDGTNATITLEREKGLVTAVAASTADCRLNALAYKKLCSTWSAGRYYVSFMGLTPIQETASTYQWIQTWGPANVMGGDEVPGSGNSLRSGMFNIDGTLIWSGDPIWSDTGGAQYIGYLISSTGAGTSASWFVYLMIAR